MQACRRGGWGISREVALALALVGLTLVVYGPALDAGFVWDDDANVTANLPLRDAAGLRSIWLEPGATTQYYPLVYTSLWLEYQAWGLDPRGYHLDNILLHALCAILLWRLLRRLDVAGAWVAAAVFALHPVHVESVAWVTERKNVLSGFFYLSSALVYLRWQSREAVPPAADGRGWAGWLAAFSLYLAALLSKSPTASLPAALLLVIWWQRGRLERRDWLPLLPWMVAAVPIGGLTVSMEKYVGTYLGLEWHPSLVERCLLAGRALFFYAGKLAWPADLAFVYPRWDIDDGQAWQYIYPLAAVALAVALLLARKRLGRGPLTALLFFAGTLAPVLGFLEVYYFRFSYVADHWQYLASIGPIVAVVGAGAHWLGQRAPGLRRAGAAFAGVWLAALGLLTWQQSHAYHDSETLWRLSLARSPSIPMVHYNLALLLEMRGEPEEAADHYRRSIQLEPREPAPYNNLALLRAGQGRMAEALEHFREALRIDPDYARARWNLGLTLTQLGHLDEALPHFERALAAAADRPEQIRQLAASHMQLAAILVRHDRPRAALEHYARAQELEPRNPLAWVRSGQLLLRLGEPVRAQRQFASALALEPTNAAALRGQEETRGLSPEAAR
jgi:tetratricopeptide (TPR) repeat protein